jgi:hypothetical protein
VGSKLLNSLASSKITLSCLLTFGVLLLWQFSLGWVPIADFPTVEYYLRRMGLTKIYESTWFFLIMITLFLNLFFQFMVHLDRFCQFLKGKEKVPFPAKDLEGSLKERSEGVFQIFWTELETKLTLIEFRTLSVRWMKNNLGKPAIVSRPGHKDELLLNVRKGKTVFLAAAGLSLGGAIFLAGVLLQEVTRVEARVVVEEGQQVDFLELLKGRSLSSWSQLQRNGRFFNGFYEPDFNVRFLRKEDGDQRVVHRLQFFGKGGLNEEKEVGWRKPTKWEGFQVYLKALSWIGRNGADVRAFEKENENEYRFLTLEPHRERELPEARFQILELEKSLERVGAGIRLLYQEEGKDAEKFWLFTRFPDYDFAHRKNSRYHFTVDRVEPKVRAEILMIKNSFQWVLWSGAGLFALSLLLSLLGSHSEYWAFRTKDGKVILAGWAAQNSSFQKQVNQKNLEAIGRRFKNRLATKDKSLKTQKVEIKNGWI